MEKTLSLTELQPFKLSHFEKLFTRMGHEVFVIHVSTFFIVYSGSFFKSCIHFLYIMKICMWSFDEDKIILIKLRPF